jgi:hypothetical protein
MKLKANECKDDAAVMYVIKEDIEQRWEKGLVSRNRQRMDAMQRCLTD